MSATLMDVAKRSGVSTATVSRVLNNKMVMPIPPETVERIKKAAAELDYRPNLHARALATGKTHTLGVCSTEMTDPHFALMLEDDAFYFRLNMKVLWYARQTIHNVL